MGHDQKDPEVSYSQLLTVFSEWTIVIFCEYLECETQMYGGFGQSQGCRGVQEQIAVEQCQKPSLIGLSVDCFVHYAGLWKIIDQFEVQLF